MNKFAVQLAPFNDVWVRRKASPPNYKEILELISTLGESSLILYSVYATMPLPSFKDTSDKYFAGLLDWEEKKVKCVRARLEDEGYLLKEVYRGSKKRKDETSTIYFIGRKNQP